jgi:adenylate cyclase
LPTAGLVCAAIALGVWGGTLGLRNAGLLESLELGMYDLCLRTRPGAAAADPRIALVTVSEADIKRLRQWPMSDATLATVLERVIGAGARVVGLDIYRDLPVPPGGDHLRDVFTRHQQIIVVTKIAEGASTGIPAPAAVTQRFRIGFNDVPVDRGGVVRRGLLFLDDGTTSYFSFPLQLALSYLRPEGLRVRDDPDTQGGVLVGRTPVPPLERGHGSYVVADMNGYQFMLDFQGVEQSFASVALGDVLDNDPAKMQVLRDRLVIIGVVSEAIKDIFLTPHSRGHEFDQYVSGMALHALTTSQIVRLARGESRPLRTLPEWQEMAWFALTSAAGAVLGLRVRTLWVFASAAVVGLGAIGGGAWGALALGWWIPLLPPAITWAATLACVAAFLSYRERHDRQLLMHLFSRHVSREVAQAIWRQRENFLDGGRPEPRRLIATVLFTDLIGFTHISEGQPPRTLMEWLNEYLDAMVEQVMAHGGVVNKYVGDAIMAIFGVPVPRATEEERRADALNAVRCAVAMDAALLALNQRWSDRRQLRLGMRIGIFTGEVIAGSVGSSQRLEYTVLGDTVNTAARLESFDKKLFEPNFVTTASRILIGAPTQAYLGDEFATEPVGEVHLSGKDELVGVYRVVTPVKEEQR